MIEQFEQIRDSLMMSNFFRVGLVVFVVPVILICMYCDACKKRLSRFCKALCWSGVVALLIKSVAEAGGTPGFLCFCYICLASVVFVVLFLLDRLREQWGTDIPMADSGS